MAKSSVFLHDSIITWKEIRRKLGLSHLISKNMPFWSHPEFPRGSENPMFRTARSKGLKTAVQLFHWDEKRAEKWSMPKTLKLAVFQLTAFCQSRLDDLSNEAINNLLDNLVKAGKGGTGLPSLHRTLRGHPTNLTHEGVFKKWKTRLQDPSVPDKILKGWEEIKKNVTNESWRESHFKPIHTWVQYPPNRPNIPTG